MRSKNSEKAAQVSPPGQSDYQTLVRGELERYAQSISPSGALLHPFSFRANSGPMVLPQLSVRLLPGFLLHLSNNLLPGDSLAGVLHVNQPGLCFPVLWAALVLPLWPNPGPCLPGIRPSRSRNSPPRLLLPLCPGLLFRQSLWHPVLLHFLHHFQFRAWPLWLVNLASGLDKVNCQTSNSRR